MTTKPYFTQPSETTRIMDVIRDARAKFPMGIEQLTDEISQMFPDFPVTYFEYRAMEGGQTKNVPVHIVYAAATILGIPANQLFPRLES